MLNELKFIFNEHFKVNPILPKNILIFKNKIYEVNNEIKNLNFKVNPDSVGLLLFDGKNIFKRLLEINQKNIKSILILNEKSSFLFTCGRTILKKSIIKKKGKGPFFIVFNSKKYILGIAKLEKKDFINIRNIGTYLKQDNTHKITF